MNSTPSLIGMRNIKTATAVILCIILTRVFAVIGENIDFGFLQWPFNFLFVRSTPLYSSIAALVAVGSTMHESYKTGLSRISGTFIGGFFAVIHLWLTEIVGEELFYYATVFVFIILIIFISSRLFGSDITATSGMIFLIIIFSVQDEPPFIYAVHRLIDTVGGVMIAIGVNRYFPIRNGWKGPGSEGKGQRK